MSDWTDPYWKVSIEREDVEDALKWLLSLLGLQGEGWHRSGDCDFCFVDQFDAEQFSNELHDGTVEAPKEVRA